jgi:NAD-dependent deacetylase
MDTAIDQAAQILLRSKHAIALTGAGVSVESGIRPFRGPDGLWTEYGEPSMDDYQQFLADPKADWERRLRRDGYLKELYEALEKASPNPAHLGLAELEEMRAVKYLITQNVDNLHRLAGSKAVAEIHGNFTRLRCIECNRRYEWDQISLEELPPACPKCGGIVKTDVVVFGEPIPSDVAQACLTEVQRADCLLSVGTSAFVYPAAGFPRRVKMRGGLLIEIDPHETELSPVCDVSIRRNAGEAMPKLVQAVKTALQGRE